MSVLKRKYSYNYYIGFTDDVDYIYGELTNIDIDGLSRLIDYNIFLLKKLPNTTTFNYIDDNIELSNVLKYKTLTNMLLDYLENIDYSDTESINDYESIESLMDNCVIIRENTITNTCKIIEEESIYKNFNKILYKFYYNTDELQSNIDSKPIIIDLELFYKTISECMSIFKYANLTTSVGDNIKVELKNNVLIFGGKKSIDKSFRINLPQKIYYGLGCILRVETTSKVNDNIVYEVYGIFANIDKCMVLSAESVMDSTYKNIPFDSDITKYDIYCDLDGNKFGKLI